MTDRRLIDRRWRRKPPSACDAESNQTRFVGPRNGSASDGFGITEDRSSASYTITSGLLYKDRRSVSRLFLQRYLGIGSRI